MDRSKTIRWRWWGWWSLTEGSKPKKKYTSDESHVGCQLPGRDRVSGCQWTGRCALCIMQEASSRRQKVKSQAWLSYSRSYCLRADPLHLPHAPLTSLLGVTTKRASPRVAALAVVLTRYSFESVSGSRAWVCLTGRGRTSTAAVSMVIVAVRSDWACFHPVVHRLALGRSVPVQECNC